MRITLAWWNTCLSPLSKSRATEEQRLFAIEVIKNLTERRVDFLALGEVSADDLSDFRTQLELHDYGLYNGALKKGRLQFDTGALYRKDTLQLCNSEEIVTARGDCSLKVANRLDFLLADKPLYIFISHWPSRLHCHELHENRRTLGESLRGAVEELYKRHGVPPNVILVGDYNDEPYDISLRTCLKAVRDRGLVREKPGFLYNPFWRHLGENVVHIPGTQCKSHSGSYYYKSSQGSPWYTFDQMIFSAPFLGQGEWQLDEECTRILQILPLDSPVSKSYKIFDHFPVLSVIEKEK
jgi:hypothetical protein